VGFEPSGSVHIGHLLTINKLMELQNKNLASYNRAKRCFGAMGLRGVWNSYSARLSR